MKNYTKDFLGLNKSNADIAGGKGASLGEMMQAGIPVPSGFVVLSASFEQFIKETDLIQEIDSILSKVNHREIHTVESASEKIRELILNAEMPKDIATEINLSFKELNTKYVAVRSSATAEDGKDHAWAGQLESYLNTTEDDILNKVKLCWSSLFTPRAIFYRFEKGLDTTKISVAVVVQKMVVSEVSGIAFSVHPVTEDPNQLIIEAGFGLGEAIVSGSVTPDSYVIEKQPRNILDINVSTQDRGLYRSGNASLEHGNNEWVNIPEPKASSQVLTKDQILELSEIIISIENHYGFPCDIEWAYENGEFYIVQSRPITTLSNNQKYEAKDLIPNIKNFTHIFSRPQSVLRDEIAFILFGPYNHIPSLRVMTVPLEGSNRAIYIDSIFLKKLFEYLLNNISTKEGWISHLKQYEELTKKYLKVAQEIKSNIDSDKKTLLKLFKKAIETIPGLGDFAWTPVPIEKILVPQFIELLQNEHPEDWEEISGAISSPVKLYGYQKMRLDICEAVINNQVDSKEVIQKLINLHKYQGEYSYVEPLFDKDYFKSEFSKLTVEVANQEKMRIENEIKHNQTNLDNALAKIKDEKLALWATVINEYTFLRTDRVDLLKKIQVPIRDILDRIAEHLSKDSGKTWTRFDVVNLLNAEIIDYLENKLVPDLGVALKRNEAIYYRTRDDLKVINDIEIVEKIKDSINTVTDKTIKGTIAFKGVAKGEVKMVFSKADLPKVKKGDILVSRTTMPDYTPAMEIAAAFITEEGGITSHAAIIARELKKPCIVATGNCTKVLKDGDIVEVDAENGIVKIIEKAK